MIRWANWMIALFCPMLVQWWHWLLMDDPWYSMHRSMICEAPEWFLRRIHCHRTYSEFFRIEFLQSMLMVASYQIQLKKIVNLTLALNKTQIWMFNRHIRLCKISTTSNVFKCFSIKSTVNATIIHDDNYNWELVAEHCLNFHSWEAKSRITFNTNDSFIGTIVTAV